MKVLFYSTRDYEKTFLIEFAPKELECSYINVSLNSETVKLAKGYKAVCIFVNDDVSSVVIDKLSEYGIQYIAIRATGYDNVDIIHAKRLNIDVCNVPEYSSHAIAEHATMLILALSRKIKISNKNIIRNDFSTDKLIGYNLNQKTVGIIGTGKIGSIFAKIMNGFGCNLLGNDIIENSELVLKYNLKYVSLNDLFTCSDIISLHVDLNPGTKYLINKNAIEQMKNSVILINTSRGKCVNTEDVLAGLSQNKIGYFGADVYEHEKGIFFHDLSGKNIEDSLLLRLMSMDNVLITPHQAFATKEAITNLIQKTYENLIHMKFGYNKYHIIN